MNSKGTEQNIFKRAVSGDENAFNLFFEKSWNHLKLPLNSLTGSDKESRRIFIEGMSILWESFIIHKKSLPANVQSYLYTICKNEWLAEKKKSFLTDRIEDLKNHEIQNHEVPDEELKEKDEKDLKIKTILSRAIQMVSGKCKKIIELHIEKGLKLKDIWEQLGYSSYPAIVQAKYNCKKKLGDYIFRELNKKGSHTTQTKGRKS